jgi:hypothetical protein
MKPASSRNPKRKSSKSPRYGSIKRNGKSTNRKVDLTHEGGERILQVPIARIELGNRYRKDFGDLRPLAKSIKEIGLLQPIGIDENYKLVFGGRRLFVCRDVLKLKMIEARIVKISSIIRGEHDENELRKDFTASEKVAIAKALQQEIGERRGNPSIRRNCSELNGRSDDIVAKKAGFSSADSYLRAKKVVEQGTSQLVDAMDADKVAISTAARIADLSPEKQNKLLNIDARKLRQVAAKLQANGHVSAAPKKQTEAVSGTNNWVKAIVTDLKNHWSTVESILIPVCDEQCDVKLKLIEKRVLVGKLREIKELHHDLERAEALEQLTNR